MSWLRLPSGKRRNLWHLGVLGLLAAPFHISLGDSWLFGVINLLTLSYFPSPSAQSFWRSALLRLHCLLGGQVLAQLSVQLLALTVNGITRPPHFPFACEGVDTALLLPYQPTPGSASSSAVPTCVRLGRWRFPTLQGEPAPISVSGEGSQATLLPSDINLADLVDPAARALSGTLSLGQSLFTVFDEKYNARVFVRSNAASVWDLMQMVQVASPDYGDPVGYRILRHVLPGWPLPQLVVWARLGPDEVVVPFQVPTELGICTIRLLTRANPVAATSEVCHKCGLSRSFFQDVARHTARVLVDWQAKEPFDGGAFIGADSAILSATTGSILRPTVLGQGHRPFPPAPFLQPVHIADVTDADPIEEVHLHAPCRASVCVPLSAIARPFSLLAQARTDVGHPRAERFAFLQASPCEAGTPPHALITDSLVLPDGFRWSVWDMRRVGHAPLLPYFVLPIPAIVDLQWVRCALRKNFPSISSATVAYVDWDLLDRPCAVHSTVPLVTLVPPGNFGNHEGPAILETVTLLVHRPGSLANLWAGARQRIMPRSLSGGFYSVPGASTTLSTTWATAFSSGPPAGALLDPIGGLSCRPITVYAASAATRFVSCTIRQNAVLADLISFITEQLSDIHEAFPDDVYAAFPRILFDPAEQPNVFLTVTNPRSPNTVWVDARPFFTQPVILVINTPVYKSQVAELLGRPELKHANWAWNGAPWHRDILYLQRGDVLSVKPHSSALFTCPFCCLHTRVVGIQTLTFRLSGPCGEISAESDGWSRFATRIPRAAIQRHWASICSAAEPLLGDFPHFSKVLLVGHGIPPLRWSAHTRLPPSVQEVQRAYDAYLAPLLGPRTWIDTGEINGEYCVFVDTGSRAHRKRLWIVNIGHGFDAFGTDDQGDEFVRTPAPYGYCFRPTWFARHFGEARLCSIHEPVAPMTHSNQASPADVIVVHPDQLEGLIRDVIAELEDDITRQNIEALHEELLEIDRATTARSVAASTSVLSPSADLPGAEPELHPDPPAASSCSSSSTLEDGEIRSPVAQEHSDVDFPFGGALSLVQRSASLRRPSLPPPPLPFAASACPPSTSASMGGTLDVSEHPSPLAGVAVSSSERLNFVRETHAIERVSGPDLAFCFTVFDSVRQTRLVKSNRQPDPASCIGVAAALFPHFSSPPSLRVLRSGVSGLPRPQIVATPSEVSAFTRTLPLDARTLGLGLCVVDGPLDSTPFSLAFKARDNCQFAQLHQGLARGTLQALFDGLALAPFEALPLAVDSVMFVTPDGRAPSVSASSSASSGTVEAVQELRDLELASFEHGPTYQIMLHVPGHPPYSLEADRHQDQAALASTASELLGPLVTHSSLHLHWPGLTPVGTDCLLHALVELDFNLRGDRTIALFDGRALNPCGPGLQSRVIPAVVTLGELFCITREVFPSAFYPSQVRVNGRILLSQDLVRLYCPLLRPVTIRDAHRSSRNRFAAALPTQEIVSMVPGLALDVQSMQTLFASTSAEEHNEASEDTEAVDLLQRFAVSPGQGLRDALGGAPSKHLPTAVTGRYGRRPLPTPCRNTRRLPASLIPSPSDKPSSQGTGSAGAPLEGGLLTGVKEDASATLPVAPAPSCSSFWPSALSFALSGPLVPVWAEGGPQVLPSAEALTAIATHAAEGHGYAPRMPLSLEPFLFGDLSPDKACTVQTLQQAALVLSLLCQGIQVLTPCPFLGDLVLSDSTKAALACVSGPALDLQALPAGSIVHIYTDGSRLHGHAGWACAVLVQLPCGIWLWQGAFAASSRQGIFGEAHFTSGEAEAAGVCAAISWALSIPGALHFVVHTDCDWARCYAEGTWGGRHPPDEHGPFAIARQLVFLLESLGRSFLLVPVRSHCGHPWNDLADCCARKAATSPDLPLSPLCAAWSTVLSSEALAWLWHLPHNVSHRGLPDLWALALSPPSPASPSPAACAKQFSEVLGLSRGSEAPASMHLRLSMVSLNVLTLRDRDPLSASSSVQVPSVQALLQQQLHAKDVLLVGLQETRLPSSSSFATGHFFVLSSAADEHGQGGTALWINTALAYGHDSRGRELHFHRKHCFALHADPRRLLVRICSPGIKVFAGVLHAPHSARPLLERQAWWEETDRLFRSCTKDDDEILLFVDSNARVGSFPSPAIGSSGADKENSNGELFREFLDSWDLFLPSTTGVHQGQHWTWTSPHGQRFRIDFLAVPRGLQQLVGESYVLPDLDHTQIRDDHLPVFLSLAGIRPGQETRPSSSPVAFHPDPDLVQAWRVGLASLTPVPWRVSVDEHAFRNIRAHQRLMKRCSAPMQRRPRQPYISQASLQLVAFRKHVREQVRSLTEQSKQLLLLSYVRGWRGLVDQVSHSAAVAALPAPSGFLDLRIAAAGRALQLSALELRASIRQDKLNYLQTLAGRLEHASHSGQAKELYQALACFRPNVGKRKRLHPLLGVSDSAGQVLAGADAVARRWSEHFAAIEGGSVSSVTALVSSYLSAAADRPTSPAPALRDLPTRHAWETTFHGLVPSKAPGPGELSPAFICLDKGAMAAHTYPLCLKTAQGGREPLFWRGGRAFALYKGKGDARLCQNSRSILVSDILAKRWHKLLRTAALPAFSVSRTSGQSGVCGGATTSLLSLWVRACQQYLENRDVSFGVLFTDVRSAFYTVMRQFLDKPPSAESFVTWGRELGLDEDQLDLIVVTLMQDSCQLSTHLSPFLSSRIADTLSATWFSVTGDSCPVITSRGTRPGDPLADLMFAFILSGVLKDCNAAISHARLAVTVHTGGVLPGVEVGEVLLESSVSWHDDCVFLFQSADASSLRADASVVARLVAKTFQSRGLDLAYAKGKTELLLNPKGPGHQQARRVLFVPQDPAICFLPDVGVIQWVRLVRDYTHLGSDIDVTGRLRSDIRRRIGFAKAASSPLKRRVFGCRQIPLPVRRTIFRSLVLSRATHNIGAWSFMNLSSKQAWQGGCITLYRHLLCGAEVTGRFHNAALCKKLGLPPPLALIRFERVRLLSLTAQRGFTSLLQILEASIGDRHCWLTVALSDLQWLIRLRPTPAARSLQDLDLASLFGRLRDQPNLVATLVSKAWHLISQDCTEADFVRVQVETKEVMVCKMCGTTCQSRRGLHAHMALKHTLRLRGRFYARGRVCQCCNKTFSNRERLIKHLVRGRPSCLRWLQCHAQPLTADEEAALSKSCRSKGKPSTADLCRAYTGPSTPLVLRQEDARDPFCIEDFL